MKATKPVLVLLLGGAIGYVIGYTHGIRAPRADDVLQRNIEIIWSAHTNSGSPDGGSADNRLRQRP